MPEGPHRLGLLSFKRRKMKNRSELALARFENDYNCAQSVLSVFQKELGIELDMALKLSAGFGGGMGRKGEVCGALSGGIMAVGARFGKDTQGDEQDSVLTISKTRELIDYFTEKHGTRYCRELLPGCDLATDEGQKRVEELDLKNKVCKQCVSGVVEKLEELLEI